MAHHIQYMVVVNVVVNMGGVDSDFEDHTSFQQPE